MTRIANRAKALRALAVLAAALTAACLAASPAASAGRAESAAAESASVAAGLVSSIVTVQPLDPAAGPTAMTVRAQPGEFESVQVILRGSGGGALHNVTVSTSALSGPG